jgi:hypothetical protein
MATLGLHTTDDLLRTSRSALAARLPGATLARIRAWQSFCDLLTLRDITPADAAQLAAVGADSVSEVSRWTMARMRAALAGTDDEAILTLLKDAVRLSETGVINGTVRLKDDTPVAGAAVTLAAQTATTDTMGRFRILRLPLDVPHTATVTHPTLGAKLQSGLRASRSSALTGVTVTLSGRPATLKPLSAMRGDVLPPLGSAPITTSARTGAPDPSDLLRVIDRFTNGDARTASLFLDFDAGRFVRRTYRIAATDLPAGLQDGDDLEWTGTLWALARFSAREIARIVRSRAMRRAATSGKRTPAKIDRAATALVKALSDR